MSSKYASQESVKSIACVVKKCIKLDKIMSPHDLLKTAKKASRLDLGLLFLEELKFVDCKQFTTEFKEFKETRFCYMASNEIKMAPLDRFVELKMWISMGRSQAA